MDPWDLMQQWALVIPPSRPSAVQLARIKLHIREIDRSQPVAILGSTPEFRDLLFESGFREIHVLERNSTFFYAVSALRVYQNQEEVISGDWLDTLPSLSEKFAIILSDLTSGNIPYESRTRFYQLIANALSPGGLFLDKILTHTGSHIPLNQIEAKYSELPLNLVHINHFSCEALFCSELLDIGSVVDSTLFYTILDDRLKDPRTRVFAKLAQRITPPGFKWWYGRRWNELSRGYCENLTRLSVEEDEPLSPYCGRLKHFAFIKPHPARAKSNAL